MFSRLFQFYHLQEIRTSYWKHFKFSANLSWQLFIGSCKAMIHALYPDICVDSTTNLSDYLSRTLDNKKKLL